MIKKVIRSLSSFFVGLGLGVALMGAGVSVSAQGGPFGAQLENFWRLISNGGRKFANLQATNATITGTCTGCGAGFGGTVNQWALGNGTFTASPTIDVGTITASTPWTFQQTWNLGTTTFDALIFNTTLNSAATGSRYLNVQNSTGRLFSVVKAGGAGTNSNNTDGCIELNSSSANTNVSLRPENLITTTKGMSLLTGLCTSTAPGTFYALAIWAGAATSGNPAVKLTSVGSVGLVQGSNEHVEWTTTADDATQTVDTGLGRNAAGVVEVNNGTNGTFRDILARSLQSSATTVGALPTCVTGLKGQRYFVTDATLNTFHSTAAGSGTNNVAVVCDGTNWYID
jgi:hypothetical protein